MTKLKGVDGSRWALLKRINIGPPDRVLLVRWRVIQTPWFGVYLHKMLQPDAQDLHNHPWDFVSVVLKGGYIEDFSDSEPDAKFEAKLGLPALMKTRLRWPQVWTTGSIHRMRRTQFHAIRKLTRVPTWTLLFVGPRKQNWGFVTPSGWIPWQEYQDNG